MTLIKKLFILCLLTFSITVQAQYTLTIDDVTFVDGEITDYTNSTQKDIIIPENFDGTPIIKIGYKAFFLKGLTSVSIGESVENIGELAFGYSDLGSIIIPSSVTSIGTRAFFLSGLESVTIGESVEVIGDRAFGFNSLESVTIPNTVITIGIRAFYNNDLTSVILGESVSILSDSAFSKNQLVSISIPNSVTSIGAYAFYDNQLIEFNLPDNYQGNIHSWSDSESNTYKSGDLVSNLEVNYILGDELITSISIIDKNVFSFYPNPSTDFIYSDLEISSLTISNSQGVTVRRYQANNRKYNVSNLEAGVYFIEAIGTDGTTYTSKFIKE